MTGMTKNIFIVLGLVTVAFAGYYMYTTQGSALLNTTNDEVVLQNMLENTQVFITHRQKLNGINISKSVSLFEDERFISLRSFSAPVEEVPIGRSDPFSEIGVGTTVNTTSR